jgi:peptidoglycan/LPS O-acetylase OafA/YrhL
LKRNLDIQDTAILKALAILAIVFHNFFHQVSPARQNEFTFDPARFGVFLHAAVRPSMAIQAFFSFFGHFGVQIFIFLSAYGLSRSHWSDPASWTSFMCGRIRKLYPQFALVVIPWFIVMALHVRSLAVIARVGLNVAFQFLGLFPIHGYGIPPVGPWWFISFIVEFYAVWPLLRAITNRWGWPGLLVIASACLAITYAANFSMTSWSMTLLFTPIGRMPVICFGIFAARYRLRVSAPLALTGLCVLLLGSRFAALWPLTFLGALFVALWMYLQVRDTLRRFPLLSCLGDYGLLVFLVNGIVRDQFVPLATSPASQLVYGCVSAAVSFAISAGMYQYLNPKPRAVRALAAAAPATAGEAAHRRLPSGTIGTVPRTAPASTPSARLGSRRPQPAGADGGRSGEDLVLSGGFQHSIR